MNKFKVGAVVRVVGLGRESSNGYFYGLHDVGEVISSNTGAGNVRVDFTKQKNPFVRPQGHWVVEPENLELLNDGEYYVFNPQRSKPSVEHVSLEEAKTEAERIAKMCPDTDIEVLKVVGSVKCEVVTKEVETGF